MRLVNEFEERTSRSPVERLRGQIGRPKTLAAQSAAFVPEGSSGGRQEQRRQPRHPLRLDATLSASDSDRQTEIYLKDVNAQFAGYLSREPLALGTRGSIRVVGNRGASIELTGTVCRCRETGEGFYEGFIAFDEPENPFDRVA
jgi:hypothetical protein